MLGLPNTLQKPIMLDFYFFCSAYFTSGCLLTYLIQFVRDNEQAFRQCKSTRKWKSRKLKQEDDISSVMIQEALQEALGNAKLGGNWSLSGF
jgi:hypothetical protein